MSEKQGKEVHISYIEQGNIIRDCVSDVRKPKAMVKATLSSNHSVQADHKPVNDSTCKDSPMRMELLRKLQKQREKIQEEQKRCEEAKKAWVKQLEELKHKNKEDEVQ